MQLITLREAAKRRGLSLRRLQLLCKNRRISGARFVGARWLVPDDFTVRPGRRGPSLRT